MWRMLRVCAILICAVVLGCSVHLLVTLHQTDRVFADYQSNLVYILGALVLLSILIVLEVHHTRSKVYRKLRQRSRHHDSRSGESAIGRENFYSVNAPQDVWDVKRRSRNKTHSSRRADPLNVAQSRVRGIKVLGLVLPVLYLSVLVYLFFGNDGALLWNGWLAITFYSALFGVAAIFAIGAWLEQEWTITCGYLLAVLNMGFFPVGTVAGLVLVVVMIGATSSFAHLTYERKRSQRRI